jgi:hypothetical protein
MRKSKRPSERARPAMTAPTYHRYRILRFMSNCSGASAFPVEERIQVLVMTAEAWEPGSLVRHSLRGIDGRPPLPVSL